MIIRKISCDNINYKNIFGELDIENRILHFNLDNQEFKNIFGFYVDERSDNSDKLDVYKNCYSYG